MKKMLILFAFSLSFILYSCSDDSTGPSEGNGRIKMYMVDAPADYDSVNIVVERVEVHKAGSGEEDGWIVINNDTNTYNLLDLRNGASVVLGDTMLAAGHYTQIRLIVGPGSYVVVNGIPYPLEIPSGFQTGVKLTHQFTIEAGVLYELVLDFDADKSIVITGTGDYSLKPTIRVAAMAISGSISGFVLPPDVLTSVWTVAGADTITTYTDVAGAFKLMALLEGTYDVYITPSNPAYRDTVITGVSVEAGVDTDIGTVTIFP